MDFGVSKASGDLSSLLVRWKDAETMSMVWISSVLNRVLRLVCSSHPLFDPPPYSLTLLDSPQQGTKKAILCMQMS